MADCSNEERNFDEAMDDLARAMEMAARGQDLSSHASTASTAENAFGMLMDRLTAAFPDDEWLARIEDLSDSYHADVGALEVQSMHLDPLIQENLNHEKQDFEEAVRALCACWHSEEGDDDTPPHAFRSVGAHGRLVLASIATAEDDDDDQMDELEEQLDAAEALADQVDALAAECADLLEAWLEANSDLG